jgi:hypothetical protein
MMVCEEHKFVFISMPKSGTHSMYDYLNKNYNIKYFDDSGRLIPIEKGARVTQILHTTKIPQKYNNYFKFSTCRHPYDRAISVWWALAVRRKEKIPADLKGKTFTEFCHMIKEGKAPHRLMLSQSERIKNTPVDLFLKIEDIDKEFNGLPFANGSSIENTFAFKTERGPNTDYLGEDEKELIYSAWRSDFTKFGYET